MFRLETRRVPVAREIIGPKAADQACGAKAAEQPAAAIEPAAQLAHTIAVDGPCRCLGITAAVTGHAAVEQRQVRSGQCPELFQAGFVLLLKSSG